MTTAVQYETVIGLEVHVQLLTRSKMFCSCAVTTSYADTEPNTLVCPVCLGMPGTLPVINRRGVEMAIMTGLALNCEIPAEAKFDRKNYPYPDLMKGYQISQYDQPLAVSGWLEIEVDGVRKDVGITRVHLEEDVAKLVHVRNAAGEAYSLVDVNRSGLPLMEIVSEPDMRSADEARAYLVKLRQILRYLDVSAANLEEGNFRCDANISLRPFGAEELGGKVEVKNINSFRFVHHALQFEVERQRQVLESGGTIPQETRGWVDDRAVTVSQRSKEYADDYRYFPEPDLPRIVVDREWLDDIRAEMPELPDAKRTRFHADYGLSEYDATIIAESRARADFFEATVAITPAADRATRAKAVANWMIGDFAALLHAGGVDISEAKVTPEALSQLIDLQEDGTISGKTAKDVFAQVFETGRSPKEIVDEAGLQQISGSGELEAAVERVLAANEKATEDYRGGKEEALKFLVGQVMRETRGRANPGIVNELLMEKLGK
ncbi:MAG: Asp-tRNA(Asn)/Glu-tRNA(Gln) amidotransferase subunit GatB [Dehalococcoidia bacterium]